ncbi:MAG TPA: VOC family protein [Acidimicrobiales bacterium]|jgi:predicted enzyme related to lactoylglutathione lyase
MTLRLQNVSIDCHDPARLADFWAEALGWRVTFADADEVTLEPADGSPDEGVVPDFEFLLVPEDKTVKNRLHLDLRPDDQVAEVERLIGLGATRVDVGQGPECTWVVLADPEGNEFCVLRPYTEAERATLITR